MELGHGLGNIMGGEGGGDCGKLRGTGHDGDSALALLFPAKAAIFHFCAANDLVRDGGGADRAKGKDGKPGFERG